MKFSVFYYLIILLAAAGCSQAEKNYVARVKLQKLNDTDIYNQEMVYDVIFDAQELKADSVKNQSRQLFLKGVDLYKNKKNPSAAVGLFKQSILMFPDAKTYYEMGNALFEQGTAQKSLEEAVQAFEVAQYLNFKPASMLYYKIAAAKNLLRDANAGVGIYSVTYNLQRAFEQGFTDTAMLQKDKNFQSLIQTGEFKDLMQDLDLKKINNDENLFALFGNSFQKYEQPFEITFENLEKMTDKQSISYDFAKYIPEMQNTSFGREVSNDFFYVAKVAETPVYTALIYSSISFWDGGPMQPVHTKLVTYDMDGKIIAGKLFAGQFSAEKVKVGKIENNEITLRDYKRIWESPIDAVPFEENKVLKYELTATATFKLTDAGQIVEVSVPANYTDSVVFAKK